MKKFFIALVCLSLFACGGSNNKSSGNVTSANQAGPDSIETVTEGDKQSHEGVVQGFTVTNDESSITVNWAAYDGAISYILKLESELENTEIVVGDATTYTFDAEAGVTYTATVLALDETETRIAYSRTLLTEIAVETVKYSDSAP